MKQRLVFAMAVAVLVVACGGRATPTAQLAQVPGFDLANVKASWTEDCTTYHDITNAAFCSDVVISLMTGAGTTIYVPTRLASADQARGEDICRTFAAYHYDPDDASDFGYREILILAARGPTLATCRTA